MINIDKKSNCCGCYACENICPKNCINMKIDNEGFWYPEVNKIKCIDCNLCIKVCPVIQNLEKSKRIIAYACKSKNEYLRKVSSSGGIFSLLCEYVINKNGVVFGAGFNEKLELIHSSAMSIEECIKFRGSKYVQSKIGSTYKEAKRYLEEGRFVLFTGTQCQIKGLNLYLNKKYDNLLSVDIVCHGVPSPLVYKKYIEALESKYKSKIKGIYFRDKKLGWNNYSYKFEFENGYKIEESFKSNMYSKGFLKDLYLRPSCYECKSKNFKTNSDITLGDYWGVEKKHKEFNDDKGTSLVMINTVKGSNIFSSIEKKLEYIKTDLNYAVSCNPSIINPVKYNENREMFFKEIHNSSLDCIIQKYTKTKFIEKVKNRIKKYIKR